MNKINKEIEITAGNIAVLEYKKQLKQNNMQITYKELADRVGDMVLFNNVTEADETLFDHTENGDMAVLDDNGEPTEVYHEIYQYYAITEGGADYLKRNTSEIVFYSEKLNLYIWGITHFGTSWDGVEVEVK